MPRPEPPLYKPIAERMLRGEIVFVLGAGASAACFPMANELKKQLLEQQGLTTSELRLDRIASRWTPEERDELEKLLDGIYGAIPAVTPGFYALLSLVAAKAPRIFVVTTNYDKLAENAIASAGKPVTLLIYNRKSRREERGKTLLMRRPGQERPVPVAAEDIVLDDSSSVVFKIHGSVGHGYVISEEDYFQVLQDIGRGRFIPPTLIRHFCTRRFLVVGNSLSDWSLRILMSVLRRPERLRGLPAKSGWSFVRTVDPEEARMWEQQHVKLFRVTGDQLASRVAPFLEAAP